MIPNFKRQADRPGASTEITPNNRRKTEFDTVNAGAAIPAYSWADVPEFVVPLRGEPLSLEQTLACGQAFRWRSIGDGIWEGVAGGRIWRLEQVSTGSSGGTAPPQPSPWTGRESSSAETEPETSPPWARTEASSATSERHSSFPVHGGPVGGRAPDRSRPRKLADGEDSGWLRVQVAPAMPETAAIAFLTDYFALTLPSREIQRVIANAHPAAVDAVADFAGLRILRQEPLETILTFTIATATNVPRVTRSIAALCQRFGAPIAEVDGVVYHDFPTPDAILAAPVDVLFGPCNLAYRARSIQSVVHQIQEYPSTWLADLARLPYPGAHRALDDLPYLGPKVADCICLFGLGHAEAVPVDVHVWAIAHELFGADIPTRTLTARTYQKIGERFRQIFGRWAGWAQQYLFCARRAVPINQRFRPDRES